MICEIPRSALALIETPEVCILQARPDGGFGLAYPGKYHFFGGGVNVASGETDYAALLRELREETTIGDNQLPREPIIRWQGIHTGIDGQGNPTSRFVTLFAVRLKGEDHIAPRPEEGGGVIEIPRNPDAVWALGDRVAPFAHQALTSFLKSESVTIGGITWH